MNNRTALAISALVFVSVLALVVLLYWIGYRWVTTGSAWAVLLGHRLHKISLAVGFVAGMLVEVTGRVMDRA